MHFEFISNNTPTDPHTRKRIRAHAAREKNLGRTHTRASRKDIPSRKCVLMLPLRGGFFPFESSPETETDDGEVEEERDEDGKSEGETTMERMIGDGLSCLPFPAEIECEVRDLVRRAITLSTQIHFMPGISHAFSTSKSPKPSMWFSLILEDEAYFHIFIALSTLTSPSPTPSLKASSTEDPIIAIRHLSRAFTLTNARLSRQDAVSDANLAVVVMMAQYERQRERYAKGFAHLAGLDAMVELRGGLSGLMTERPSLGLKVLRVDLDYALYLGTPTRFTLSDVTDACEGWSWFREGFRKKYQCRTCAFSQCTTMCSRLRELAVDMTYLAWTINDASAGLTPALDLRAFHGTLLSLGYHLLDYRSLGSVWPHCQLENAVHLGLMAFIMPFMYRFDGKIPDSPLLAKAIRTVVQDNSSTDPDTQEVMLWMLLLGVASIFKQPWDEWIIASASQLFFNLRLYTWEDVARTMARYPWTNAHHNGPGRALFKKVDLCDRLLVATSLQSGTVSPSLTIYTPSTSPDSLES